MRKIYVSLLILTMALPLAATEKVSMQIEKSFYLLGDTLCFSGMVVAEGEEASRVLHVELLAPEGYTVEKRTIEVTDGQFGGSLTLRPLFLSGLYEVRAYTLSMLNNKEDGCFSQVVPVCDKDRNGRLSILNRVIRKGDKGYKEFVCSKEKSITLYGRLEKKVKKFLRAPHYEGVPATKLTATLNLPEGQTKSRLLTDSMGYFRMPLPSFRGQGLVTLYHPVSEETEDASIRILPMPSPAARVYTEQEKSLLHANDALIVNPDTIGKKEKDWRPIIHSIVRLDLGKELKRLVEEERITPDDAERKNSGNLLASELIYDLLPEQLSYIDGVRFVVLKGKYPDDDTSLEVTKVIDSDLFDANDYEEMVLRFDAEICERYRYGSPSMGHTFWLNGSKRYAFFKNSESAANPTGRPSIIVCLTPKDNAMTSKKLANGVQLKVEGFSF